MSKVIAMMVSMSHDHESVWIASESAFPAAGGGYRNQNTYKTKHMVTLYIYI